MDTSEQFPYTVSCSHPPPPSTSLGLSVLPAARSLLKFWPICQIDSRRNEPARNISRAILSLALLYTSPCLPHVHTLPSRASLSSIAFARPSKHSRHFDSSNFYFLSISLSFRFARTRRRKRSRSSSVEKRINKSVAKRGIDSQEKRKIGSYSTDFSFHRFAL